MHRGVGREQRGSVGAGGSFFRTCYRYDRCVVLAMNSWQRWVAPAVGSQNGSEGTPEGESFVSSRLPLD